MEAVRNYNVHIDNKKRITLRGAMFQYYNVREFDNGCILLEPRELVAPVEISANTLKVMEESIENYKAGKVSEPLDLSDF